MSTNENTIFEENAYEELQQAMDNLNKAINVFLDNEISTREKLVEEIKKTINLLNYENRK